MRIAIAACLILGGCATDPGGSVEYRAELVAASLAQSKPLPLPGQCVSACTMQLLDPDVCVHPNAEIGFHAATYSGTGIISQYHTDQVASYYTRYPRLLARLAKDRALERVEVTYYSGRTLIGYGVKQCKFNQRAATYRGP